MGTITHEQALGQRILDLADALDCCGSKRNLYAFFNHPGGSYDDGADGRWRIACRRCGAIRAADMKNNGDVALCIESSAIKKIPSNDALAEVGSTSSAVVVTFKYGAEPYDVAHSRIRRRALIERGMRLFRRPALCKRWVRARERLGDAKPKVKIGSDWAIDVRTPRTARDAGINVHEVEA